MALDGNIDIGEYIQALFRDEERMERLERRIARTAGSLDRSLINVIDDAIRELMVDSEGFVLSTNFNAAVLDRIFLDVESLFRRAGAPELAGELRDIYMERLDSINAVFQEVGITSATVQNIDSLPQIRERIEGITQRLAPSSEVAASRIREKIQEARSALAGSERLRFKNLREELVRSGGVLPQFVGTVANTELNSITRLSRIAQAQRAGATEMRYSGVLDNLTRDFCRSWVGKVRSVKFWENLNNDTGPNPVSTYCGGYNCRHRLAIWSSEWENPDPVDIGM